jgi:protein involved in sex pheromone biosynthesis
MAFAQDEIASADASGWRDTVVDAVTPGGWLALTTVDSDERLTAWNHSDLASALSPGDPVAINVEQHVLAVGDFRFNVLVV